MTLAEKKDLFLRDIEILTDSLESERDLGKALSKFGDGYFIPNILGRLPEQLITTLSYSLTLDTIPENEESVASWIDWWVWENDCGKGELCASSQEGEELQLVENADILWEKFILPLINKE